MGNTLFKPVAPGTSNESTEDSDMQNTTDAENCPLSLGAYIYSPVSDFIPPELPDSEPDMEKDQQPTLPIWARSSTAEEIVPEEPMPREELYERVDILERFRQRRRTEAESRVAQEEVLVTSVVATPDREEIPPQPSQPAKKPKKKRKKIKKVQENTVHSSGDTTVSGIVTAGTSNCTEEPAVKEEDVWDTTNIPFPEFTEKEAEPSEDVEFKKTKEVQKSTVEVSAVVPPNSSTEPTAGKRRRNGGKKKKQEEKQAVKAQTTMDVNILPSKDVPRKESSSAQSEGETLAATEFMLPNKFSLLAVSEPAVCQKKPGPSTAPTHKPTEINQEKSFVDQEAVFSRLVDSTVAGTGRSEHDSLLCTIVGHSHRGWVFVEPVGSLGKYESDGRFIVLDSESRSKSIIQTDIMNLPVTYNIRIYGIERREEAKSPGKHMKSLLSKPIWRAKLFSFTDKPAIHQTIVAVTEVDADSCTAEVVGTHFRQPTCVRIASHWFEPNPDRPAGMKLRSSRPEVNSLLIGDAYPLKCKTRVVTVGEVSLFCEDSTGSGEYPDEADFGYHMCSPRRLTTLELTRVDLMCRGMEKLTRAQATLYILDPLVAVSRLRHYICGKSISEHAITVRVPPDHTTTHMKIRLSPQMAQRCIQKKSIRSWRVGSALIIDNPTFCALPHHGEKETFEESPAHSIFGGVRKTMEVNIVDIRETEDFTEVTLLMSPGARDRMEILERAGKRLSGHICVAVRHEVDDPRAGILIQTFEKLFDNDSARFRQLTGRAKKPSFDVGLGGDILVGGHHLDESQRLGVWTALANPAVTTISAPAGSGKTLMLEGIIVKSTIGDQPRSGLSQPRRVLVGATTNPAATNTIQTIRADFPHGGDLKLCRHFSRSAEADLGESRSLESEVSLKRMSEKAEKYLPDINKYPDVLKAIMKVEEAEEALRKSTTVDGGILLLNELKAYRYSLVVRFAEAFNAHVFGSTVDMLSHTPELCQDYDHLVLEEAAQMDTISAFCLYGTYPEINRITLVGDSRQLRPFNELPADSEAGSIYTRGELTRLERFKNVARVELNTIYRCHPLLTAMWLRPIYGKGILAHEARHGDRKDLAQRKGLMVAGDGTPCLMVQVDGGNDNEGVNRVEKDACLSLLKILQHQHGIDLSDVVIICNHRAQKGAIIRELQNTGKMGYLRLPCIVSTIDSFQGKEAKVVIVLTTKSGGSHDPGSIKRVFRFVSEPHRGTVAVSRSTDMMYLFGDWSKLTKTKFWAQFVGNVVNSKALVTMNNGGFQRMDAAKFFNPPKLQSA